MISEPVAPHSLAALRVGLGAIGALSALRVLAYGWVQALYLQPSTLFPWVSWAVLPSPPVLYGLFALQIVAALAVMVGFRTRTSAAVFLLSFGYTELLCKTLYLNHYVLLTLLFGALLVVPSSGVWALTPGKTPRRGHVWLVRAIVASVYVWAGICKVQPDWLLHAQPLQTWLRPMVELPVVGPWLAHPWTAVAMSWGGALFDLTIVGWLAWPRTRGAAYAVLVAFHVVLWLLFPIGVFPWIMMVAATIWFEPDWCGQSVELKPAPWGLPHTVGVGLAAVVLALTPGRFLAYGTDVNWTEVGFRFAWRVMLIEKTGHVEFHVLDPSTTKRWTVHPNRTLDPRQAKFLRTSADLMLDYAHQLELQHGSDLVITVESYAALNGRPSQRYLRSDIDLTAHQQVRTEWFVPLTE